MSTFAYLSVVAIILIFPSVNGQIENVNITCPNNYGLPTASIVNLINCFPDSSAAIMIEQMKGNSRPYGVTRNVVSYLYNLEFIHTKYVYLDN